ncbi:hypothetical protein [Acidithiobacillus ferrivorans]|nr:hypothetical protein [Acidithiobacillus ferrivorans]
MVTITVLLMRLPPRDLSGGIQDIALALSDVSFGPFLLDQGDNTIDL